ncbi:MAG: hypothetical protein GQ582_10170 [Methyloprofundus sp.]|nr:hypothetical protein [Methyloprofundus sp.]
MQKLISSLFLLLLLNSDAYAAPDAISKQQAVSIAQQAYSGRVLGVKQKGNHYQVKTLLANGEVKIMLINKQTGAMTSGR